jgi:hypothetical protein
VPRSLSRMADNGLHNYVQGLSNYIQQVSGMSKVTRAKAVETAKSLLAQTGLDHAAADAGERVTKLADEVLAASRANRDLLEKLIKAEVDKAASRLGFARAEELEAIRTEIAELRRTMEGRPRAEAAGVRVSPAAEPRPTTAPTRRAAAKKAAAKKAAAKKEPSGPEVEGADQ